jgi:hypothetical protein
MIFKQFVKSKAKRVFRTFENYTSISQVNDVLAAEVAALSQRREEEFIGVYENKRGEMEETILISTLGLYLYSNEEWLFIDYDQINHIKAPNIKAKYIADSLDICITSGRIIKLPVKGGHGSYRDVWEFLRFLDRVSEVRKKNDLEIN